MTNTSRNNPGYISQREINGLLFIVWGSLAAYTLVIGTAHGRIMAIHEILGGVAVVSTGLYPITVILSSFSRSEKILKLPKLSIAIQFTAVVILHISRIAVN